MSYNDYLTNWTKILTEEEVEECLSYSAKIHWGFNSKSLTKMVKRFEDGDTKEKCKVWFILEDCNFHEVAGLLDDGKVKEAYEWANTQID